ncbi:MAG: aminoacyl-tRNA hydrolase [Nitrospirae bacterium]|nr:aminoacyl-tRNA hydrolase [Nitrospirota bacterium]
MRLIVGLGNPGARYADTRHNIGAQVVEAAAARWSVTLRRTGEARAGIGHLGSTAVVLAVPLSWMNESGPVVTSLLQQHSLTCSDLVVVHDDLDLGLGRLRIKMKGGAGGHNGLRSIMAELGTDEFLRVKLGVGRPPAGVDAADYVLAEFLAEERETVAALCDRAIEALECLLMEGPNAAMNKFHVREPEDNAEV